MEIRCKALALIVFDYMFEDPYKMGIRCNSLGLIVFVFDYSII